ncbi:type IV pilin [Methanosarcina sp. KYL-1]|uniref:type IV pilin n=1 Tax=Methanosarcina sp. KYL-1 TaxID=2602068 RepID=UPI0021018658|nr:type IV pilin [Methanosarcina sp. KYL-1]MCQ1536189.1 type IV pilin [Methanosarcina sp. KYL-1]
MSKNFPILKSLDEKGVAPVIGTVLSIAIVVILTSLLSSVIFSESADSPDGEAPSAKLEISFADGNLIEFKHGGGDPLFFDSASMAVVLGINETSYVLNSSSLGKLEVGESKFLVLNNSGLPAMELEPEKEVSVKVVDYENGLLIAYSKLKVNDKIVITP